MTMPNVKIDLDAEEMASQDEVAAIEEEWKTPSIQRDKLWAMLNSHLESGTCEKTFGTTEPTIVSQMVKHQQTVYVYGAPCGLSEVQHPGCDHADYPWDPVPKVIDKIVKALLWHDQRQKQFRMHHTKADREKFENYDFMAPLVADGDMGFGGLTTTVKLARSFVEAGVAMIHLDDLAIGLKKFTVGERRTVVPTSEYLTRLTAVRMQFDIMGTNTLLMCRCDTDRSQFITSTIDPRDHEYIIGATNGVEPLIEAILTGMSNGQTVKGKATEQQYQEYASKAKACGISLRYKRQVAKSKDWRMTVWKDIAEFHTEVRKVYPNRLFAFGFTEQIRSSNDDMAKLGIVWQAQPIWAVGGLNITAEKFAKEWQRDGIAGYIETISKPSRLPPIVDGFHRRSYAGSNLADAFFAAVVG
ncbi:Pyruvate/Phosphoenolpyruvate kinase-like domain-containing protein [Thelonectria olida]|uniref:methylisocitrate lyase n=1 Tax=Thelonectria olida TaxID=1576542 RepID=A0A9P9AH66_9HYPO|nr:Pyruvate/Phosphoenolpyruvate kinase-like domain-containing protein [Thelonectria olida]